MRDKPKPKKVPQPHGGALLTGGVPGNRGGKGAVPSAIRGLARASFAERLPKVERIADGIHYVQLKEKCEKCGHVPEREQSVEEMLRNMPTPADSLRAMDILAKYGLGQERTVITVDSVQDRLTRQLQILKRELAPEVFERVEPMLAEVWE